MFKKVLTLLILGLTFVKAEERPNILFIFSDDWGWGDLSVHGHPYIKTPNIDRLAKEGTDFHRFTVASGVCSPSRTAVMTGHFPARHSINGHFAYPDQNAQRGMPDWLNPELVLLPRLLKQAGYATAHFGKWHLANNMIPDSPLPVIYGYDEASTFNSSGEQMPVHDDIILANQFIEKSHKEKKPFFLNLWVHEPHTPHHVVPKYQQKFPELTKNQNIYASILAHADDRIGTLLNKLDELGIADNTLVIFSSDNGPAGKENSKGELKLMYDSATGAGYNTSASVGSTAGRRGRKASLLEGGIGVPFIVRWPAKVEAGKVDATSLISAVDLLPTFCSLADAKLPENYVADGLDQTKALLGEAFSERSKPLFWKASSNSPAKPHYTIVTGKWKMLTSPDLKKVELFDITKDVYEATDLQEKHPEIVNNLKVQIQDWVKTLPEGPDPSCFSKHRTK